MAKLNPLSGKLTKDVQNYLNQILAIRSFLENGFEATSISKTILLSSWKRHFSVFCKIWSDENETVLWESEASVLNQHFVMGSFLESGFEGT